MSLFPSKPSVFPVFTSVHSGLIGTNHQIKLLKTSDSIIIWPEERVVSSADYDEVTVWAAPRVLPIVDIIPGGEVLYTETQPQTVPANEQSAAVQQQTIGLAEQLPVQQLDTIQPSPTFALLTSVSQSDSSREAFITLGPAPTGADKKSWGRSLTRLLLLGVMVVSLVVMASAVVPEVYYRLQPEKVADVTGGQTTPSPTVIVPVATPQPALPLVDPTLPQGEWLRIPTIGVDAGILATSNPDEALVKGAWMVPDFGRPADFSQPTIIASHRYGWLWWWQSDFGKKNSFYYLPETKLGDTIEVITDQRRFVYEIYAMEEGESINDYAADLILYTCKFLNSPERYFVYAKRLPADETPTASEPQSGKTAIFDKT